MGDTSDIRRHRLLFRSCHHGIKELDLLLGSFAERHLAALSDAQLNRYEALMENGENKLFDLISSRIAPGEHDSDVLRLLIEFATARGPRES
jgi:antitoxin CptB